MKKILLIFFCSLLLNSCGQTTALLGPAIAIGNTGNVMQAGFSYSSNMAVKGATGKTPGEHVTSYVKEKKDEKRLRKEMVRYLKSHMKIMRSKLNTKQNLN